MTPKSTVSKRNNENTISSKYTKHIKQMHLNNKFQLNCNQLFYQLLIKNFISSHSNGYFFAVYDLSTSGRSGTNYVIPSIRVGHLRTKVTFNRGLPIDLTMLVYCEFPATLYLGKTGKVGSSFV